MKSSKINWKINIKDELLKNNIYAYLINIFLIFSKNFYLMDYIKYENKDLKKTNHQFDDPSEIC